MCETEEVKIGPYCKLVNQKPMRGDECILEMLAMAVQDPQRAKEAVVEKKRDAQFKIAQAVIEKLILPLTSLILIQQKFEKNEEMKDKLNLKIVESLAATTHEMVSMAHKAIHEGGDFERWTMADVKTISEEVKRSVQRFSRPPKDSGA